MIKIAIYGANGRMGKAVTKLVENSSDTYKLIGKITRDTSAKEIEEACRNSDIIIDFSTPQALVHILEPAIKQKTAIVICTTGLDDAALQLIDKAAKQIPLIYAPNTSLGANIIKKLAEKVSTILQDSDVEIVETHHRDKKDAPSGTALAIAKSIAEARGIDFDKNVVIGRAGNKVRQKGEIGISSIRCGHIFAENEVIFADDNEVIAISHTALNREVFAEGALKAATWLYNKPAGLYLMKDVLGTW